MSQNKIEKLITELCPNGVEFKVLGKVLTRVDGNNRKIPKSEIRKEGQYPVYTQGASQKPDGYSDDNNNLISDVPLIVYGDHTNVLKWIDHDFIAGADGVKLIKTSREEFGIDNKFLYYCLRDRINEIQDGYARHFAKLREILIPVPPLTIQEEIVKILDTFTDLEAELEAELEARKMQYEYYRDGLLSFGYDEVRWLELEKVCLSINAGGDLPENYLKGQKEPTDEFLYPIYSNGTESSALYGYTDSYKVDKDAVTISARGTIGYHTIRKAKFTPIVRLITLIPNPSILTTSFLNYILDITEISGNNGGIPQLTVPTVKKIKIPVPYKNGQFDLEKQQEIVSVLDQFDALVNDISIGLPAELRARRKQYEYYRNKLLTFPEIQK